MPPQPAESAVNPARTLASEQVSAAPNQLHAADLGALPGQVAEFIADRLRETPLGRRESPEAMTRLLAGAITEDGLGVGPAWDVFVDAVVPNNIGLASERFLAFIPVAPSAASVWMDAAVSAANFSAESWLEASGAVAAENQALRVLADLVGFPERAGGCFMSGGSIGNLSALAVGRDRAGGRRSVAVADTAHASVGNALHLLGLDAVVVPTGPDGRFIGAALRAMITPDVGMVCAAGGSTNAGVVDDLAGLAMICDEHEMWLHVDAAYGGAALLVEDRRHLFAGIERADSVIIDPHKWLFGPAGSCALLYRHPALASAVHTQHGPYIDVLHDGSGADWNPSDYGYQLTRRASGLPLWFALVTHGLAAHRYAVEATLSLARRCAQVFSETPGVEVLMEPELGVVLFRRDGWGRSEWQAWADRLLGDGIAFVAPTTWRGEPVGRLVFMHPLTPPSLITDIAATLRHPGR